MNSTSKRLGDLDVGSLRTVGDDSTWNDLSYDDGIERDGGLGDSGGRSLGGDGFLLGLVGDDEQALLVVLRDDDQVGELLSQLNGV